MTLKNVKQYLLLQVAKHGPTNTIRRTAFGAADLVSLGTKTYLGPGVTVTPVAGRAYGETLLHIGDRVAISPDVSFICSDSPHESKLAAHHGGVGEIVVEDDVWLGADATILRGVRLGARSIVGAGATVTTDVPPDSVVGGVPAKPLEVSDRKLATD